jgi:DNA repair protein RadC
MVDRDFTLHDLPKPERPRERLRKFGVDALSAAELLALVIGRGVRKNPVMNIAQELLNRFGSVKGISEASVEELSKVRGIGLAKAAQIRACFELGKRQDLEVEDDEVSISNPRDVARAVRQRIQDKAKEHFTLVLLNTRNKIIRIETISTGTLNASLVHPREVFKEAITHTASSVVIAHNHPSGDTEPSEDDIRLTRRLVEVGRLVGIEVLDHIIVTKKEYLSFKEKGLM